MSIIRWIISLPLIVGAIFFALEHPDIVSITWSPTQEPIELPLYFVVLIAIGTGFLLGAAITWLSMGNLRKERRQQKKLIKRLEKDIHDADEQLNDYLRSNKKDEQSSNYVEHNKNYD